MRNVMRSPREPSAAAFSSDDQNRRWPLPGQNPAAPRRRARSDEDEAALSRSLADTLRELAVTIVGFVGVIVLIIAIVSAFRG
jgi:hypothetical protein